MKELETAEMPGFTLRIRQPGSHISRQGRYLAERFGIQLVVIQLLMYCTGMLYGKAVVGRGPLDVRFGDVAGVVALVMFFLLARVFDEHKDYEFDVVHLADRPLPRGAISWAEVNGLGVAAMLIQVAICVALDGGLGRVCAWWAIAMAYLVLTRFEFFVRPWLRRHFVTNTVTHLPVYALASVWAAEVGARPRWVPATVAGLAAYTCFHTFGADLWRKSRAPQDERPEVDTYTQRWGTTGASLATAVIVIVAAGLAAAMLAAAHAGATAGYAALGLAPLPVLAGLVRFTRDPSRETNEQRRKLLTFTLVALQLIVIITIGIQRGLSG
jgi:4-hydroxybenzoate polyprenyltransferase